MTTVGTDEGRNYARINLKLVDQGKRHRTQKELEKALPKTLPPIPGIELTLGFNRPIFVNILGADPVRLVELANEIKAKFATIPGIADLELSEKPANPAVSVRLNNDAAADLGITVQQVGDTL